MKKKAESITTLVLEMSEAGMTLDPLDTALILGYEVGEIQKCAFYANCRGDSVRQAYVDSMQCGIADAIMQLRVLTRIHDLDFIDMTMLGEERLRERMEEIGSGKRAVPVEELAELRSETMKSGGKKQGPPVRKPPNKGK